MTPSTKVGSTRASTLQAERLAAIDLDQPVPEDDDNISQATSLVSTASGQEGSDKAHVFELHTLSPNYGPFECPYCRGIVHFKHQRAWRYVAF